MGQGTSPPVAPAAAAAPANSNTSSLSDNQIKAISMLMSQMGKGGSAMPVVQQQMTSQPATQTIHGGTLINPQQR